MISIDVNNLGYFKRKCPENFVFLGIEWLFSSKPNVFIWSEGIFCRLIFDMLI
jgi:hypothetical protein